MTQPVLQIRSSPHVVAGASVDTIMFHVVLALLPTAGFAVYAFGLAALLTIGAAVVCCVLFEHLFCRLAGKPTTIGDWSAVITGLLFGLVLPPTLPLWMVATGALVSIGLGKALFGGLGSNPFNPALVGRAALQAAFPVAMTTWGDVLISQRFSGVPSSSLALPFSRPELGADAISSATPLAAWKFDGIVTETSELLFGMCSGSVGETGSMWILAGGIYLSVRGMMNWRIPAVILATVAMFSGALHLIAPDVYPSPWFFLFSGGLMLGAVFMATDMVGSPITNLGAIIYAVLIGALVVIIRVWGGMPEGVMYAILLGNAATPLIDTVIQPRVFGSARRTP